MAHTTEAKYQELKTNSHRNCESCLGIRHFQMLMLVLGSVIISSVRTSLSIAIVVMTDKDNVFDWSHQTQSVVLSSLSWGVLVLKLFAGELTARFGGMGVMTACVAVNSLASLILPLAEIYGGWQMVCACRVMQGAASGLLMPSVHYLITKWVPEEEKGLWGTIVHASVTIGMALQLIVGGYIATYWGWQAIFYVTGGLGMVWTVCYMFLGADSPETSKMISDEEKLYIQHSLGHIGGHKTVKTPWKAILTSLPVFALFVTNVGAFWGITTISTELPTYLNHVLGVNIRQNGIMSAVPYIGCYVVSFPIGYLSDYILNKKWLTRTNCRKMFNTIAAFGTAIFLIALSYSPSDVITVVSLITVAEMFTAAFFAGWSLVHLDLAPNHASSLVGIVGFAAGAISLAAPLLAGFIIQDETSPSEWRKVFFVSAGIYVVTSLFFVAFGTSKTQKWNEPAADLSKPEKKIFVNTTSLPSD